MTRAAITDASLAAAGLIAGYAVADLTGQRWIGGIVLVLFGVLCGLRWRQRLGLPTALLLGFVYLVAFVLSHVLALAITAWPAVLIVAALTAGASLLADRRAAQNTADSDSVPRNATPVG